jgi:hypothetical protein
VTQNWMVIHDGNRKSTKIIHLHGPSDL